MKAWGESYESFRDRVLARVPKIDTMEDFRDKVLKDLPESTSFEEFRDTVTRPAHERRL